MEQVAQHTASDLRRAQVIQRRQRELQQPQVTLEKKKMTGPGFYCILLLAILKDALDMLLDISIFLSILVVPMSFLLGACVFLYFVAVGVKWNTRKVAVTSITMVIDAIPFIDFLPLFTLSIILTRWMTNRDIKKRNHGRLQAGKDATRAVNAKAGFSARPPRRQVARAT